MKKKILFALGLVVLIHLILFFYFLFSTPNFGDASFHQNIISSNFEKETLNSNVPYLKGSYGFPRYIEEYPVAYPQLYYVFGTIIYPFFQEKTVYFIDLILTTSLIIISFLIGRFFFNEKISMIFATLVGLTSGLIYGHGNSNTILLFGGILSLYSILIFYKSKNFSSLILFIIFSVFTLGTKQLGYFYIAGLIMGSLSFFLFYRETVLLKKFLLAIFFILVLWLPIIGYQVYTTGTISTPAVEGWPIVDSFIFSPKYLNLPEWQIEIDKLVNITYLDKISTTKYYEVNNKFLNLFASPKDFINQYFMFNTITLLPRVYKQKNVSILFTLLFLLGILLCFFPKRRVSNNQLKKVNPNYFLFNFLASFIVIMGFLVLLFTSKIEYYLFFPYLGLFLISIGINCFKKKRLILILIIFTVIFSLMVFSTNEVFSLQNFAKSTYMRGKIPGGYNSLIELANWINENSNEKDLILASNTQDLPYYAKRNFFWDYRLFFLKEYELLYYLDYYPDFRYVVISKNQLSEKFTNWVNIPLNSPFLRVLKNNTIFNKVYEKNDLTIYELKNETK